MAPAATDIASPRSYSRDGQALEETSDNIDSVNALKAVLTAKWNEKSAFDAEKDRTSFRKYEEACDRVKNFYREQHEKQTVAYNLKARSDFKFKGRDEMTIWEAMER